MTHTGGDARMLTGSRYRCETITFEMMVFCDMPFIVLHKPQRRNQTPTKLCPLQLSYLQSSVCLALQVELHGGSRRRLFFERNVQDVLER